MEGDDVIQVKDLTEIVAEVIEAQENAKDDGN